VLKKYIGGRRLKDSTEVCLKKTIFHSELICYVIVFGYNPKECCSLSLAQASSQGFIMDQMNKLRNF